MVFLKINMFATLPPDHTSPTHSASSHNLSSRRSHSQSQHQHDPPQPPRHSNHERQSSDELRRYYHSHSASQQPLRSHSHHASPKRTYIQSAGHSDSRLVAEHHYPPPPGVVMVGRRRSREEHEEVGGAGGRYIDQRRKSADPALVVNYDPTAPPPFRGTSSSSGYNMTAPGEMSGNKEKRSSRLPFEDPGSDEGCSQSCDIVNPSGITFTLEETDDIKSASSSSTLVENSSGSPLPRHQLQPDITAHKSTREQQLSQETFTEDDRQNLMVILSPLREGVPLSSQPHYYDPSFNQPPPYFGGLSQPSPPKSRHGKSLTDISSATAVAPMATMGGNSNLLALQRQFLSQSVELPHLTQHSTGQRYATDSLPRHARLVTQSQQQQQGHGLKHTQSVPLNQMYRMASDSHLNYDGPPGQKMSVAGALARVKEEIDQQKKQPQQQQQQAPSQPRQRGGQNHMRKQFRSHHLQKKHVQATVISPQANRPKTSSSSQEKSRYHKF